MESKNLAPFFTHLLELHDPHARSHSNHVALLAVALGRRIGLNSEQITNLDFAGKIHDIGKIVINDFIVHKPGKYTEAEYGMIQQLTTLGSNLIKRLELDPSIHVAILHHHENFDGTGYPHKIIGEQIPLEARILRIADTFDALITDRAYRPARTYAEAEKIMRDETKNFDPKLLEIFFGMNPAAL